MVTKRMVEEALERVRSAARAGDIAGFKKAQRAYDDLKNNLPTGRFGRGRGPAGQGGSNFETYGVSVDKGAKVKTLEDGIYIVKGGVCKRMKDSNGTGNVAVVYRVPPKKAEAEAEAPVKKAKKAAVEEVEEKPKKKKRHEEVEVPKKKKAKKQ